MQAHWATRMLAVPHVSRTAKTFRSSKVFSITTQTLTHPSPSSLSLSFSLSLALRDLWRSPIRITAARMPAFLLWYRPLLWDMPDASAGSKRGSGDSWSKVRLAPGVRSRGTCLALWGSRVSGGWISQSTWRQLWQSFAKAQTCLKSGLCRQLQPRSYWNWGPFSFGRLSGLIKSHLLLFVWLKRVSCSPKGPMRHSWTPVQGELLSAFSASAVNLFITAPQHIPFPDERMKSCRLADALTIQQHLFLSAYLYLPTSPSFS